MDCLLKQFEEIRKEESRRGMSGCEVSLLKYLDTDPKHCLKYWCLHCANAADRRRTSCRSAISCVSHTSYVESLQRNRVYGFYPRGRKLNVATFTENTHHEIFDFSRQEDTQNCTRASYTLRHVTWYLLRHFLCVVVVIRASQPSAVITEWYSGEKSEEASIMSVYSMATMFFKNAVPGKMYFAEITLELTLNAIKSTGLSDVTHVGIFDVPLACLIIEFSCKAGNPRLLNSFITFRHFQSQSPT